MRAILKTSLTIFVLLMAASPVFAQANRFTMTPTDNGFLRLDTQTGAISICNNNDGQWHCKNLAPKEQSTPLNNSDKIASNDLIKLQQENKELKAEIKKLEEEIFKVSKDNPGNKQLKLPSEEDVDKVMTFMERLIERLKGLGKKLQEDDKGNLGTPL